MVLSEIRSHLNVGLDTKAKSVLNILILHLV